MMSLIEDDCIFRNVEDNRRQGNLDQTEFNRNNQSLFLINVMSLDSFDLVLSFLDIENLNQFANLSNKTRNRVKQFFLNNSFQKQIKFFEKQKKTVLNEAMFDHLKSKIKFYYRSYKLSENELFSLNTQDHLLQLTILFNDLIDQGVKVQDLSEVIPYVKQRGMRQCFQDVFSLVECSYSSQVNQDYSSAEFTQDQRLTKELNQFLFILQEQRAIRSIFKFDKDEIEEREMKSQIIRYFNQKGFEKLRPLIVKRIQSQKFQKQNSIYEFLNKNNLSLILPFLSPKEIINFAQASKNMHSIISINIEKFINLLVQRKQEKIQELNIDASLIQQAEQFTYYLMLNNRIQECLQFEVVLISNLQVIVQMLDYMSDQNQSFIDLGQTYVWEYIFEQREAVYSQFIKQFIPQTNSSGQNNSSSQTQDNNTMQEEPVTFYYESQEEHSIVTQSLYDIRYKLKNNLEIDPSFKTYLQQFFQFFYPLNKQIILLTKLSNKNTFIPPLYANSVFDDLIASLFYQYSLNQQEEDDYQEEQNNTYQEVEQDEEEEQEDGSQIDEEEQENGSQIDEEEQENGSQIDEEQENGSQIDKGQEDEDQNLEENGNSLIQEVEENQGQQDQN